jgi:PleD family two-component response regulator
LVANDLTLRADPTLLATVWNELTRVTTFFAIALPISSVRRSSERLRMDAAHAFRLAVTDPLTGLYNRLPE